MGINNSYSVQAGLQSLNSRLGDLIDTGYIHRFRREADCIFCFELYVWISPDQFNVDAVYYFGNTSDPDTDRMLYAITTDSGIKGMLVDQYGVYTDNMSQELHQKLGRIGTLIRARENDSPPGPWLENAIEKNNREGRTEAMSAANNRTIKQFNNQTIGT